LDWHLLDNSQHKKLQRWVEDLNQFYRIQPALYQNDFRPDTFEWIDCHDARQSTLSFIRRSAADGPEIIVVCNFTPVPRRNYRIGVSEEGLWRECLNSDSRNYGGANHGNFGAVEASPVPVHGRLFSLNLTLPPLGILFFQKENQGEDA
jgi:1,4-alpha-glucan branching enzyme